MMTTRPLFENNALYDFLTHCLTVLKELADRKQVPSGMQNNVKRHKTLKGALVLR